jgi:hypothetical protein
MAFHRKSAMRGVTNPPIPLSTFNDMMKDRRVPPPDGHLGNAPLWSDESRERLKQDLLSGMRSRRKPDAKATAAEAR